MNEIYFWLLVGLVAIFFYLVIAGSLNNLLMGCAILQISIILIAWELVGLKAWIGFLTLGFLVFDIYAIYQVQQIQKEKNHKS